MNSHGHVLTTIMTVSFNLSLLWATQDASVMQTLHERSFEVEIEDVMFDSYVENDVLQFYPKVVILKHLDDNLSQGEYSYHNIEVRLLTANGSVIKNLWFPYWSSVGCAEHGNFFYVVTAVPEIPEPYHPKQLVLPETKHKETSFAVYDDKGKLLWKKSPYEIPYEDYGAPSPVISPKDGIVYKFPLIAYDNNGDEHALSPRDLVGYDYFWVHAFDETWSNAVAMAYKCQEAWSSSIPGKSPEPRVLFLDSLLHLRKEVPLDEYNFNDATISRTGEYVYASGYTTLHHVTGERKGGIASSTGYLFDRQGNLVMRIENGSCPAIFSDNEQYVLIGIRNPEGSLVDYFGLVDITAKEILFKKEFRIGSGVVAPNGSVVVTKKIKQHLDREQLEKMPLGKARDLVAQTEKEAKWQFLIYDKTGSSLLETAVFESNGGKIVYKILNWDGTTVTMGIVDKVQSTVRIVLFTT